jgi:hypothetical protein
VIAQSAATQHISFEYRKSPARRPAGPWRSRWRHPHRSWPTWTRTALAPPRAVPADQRRGAAVREQRISPIGKLSITVPLVIGQLLYAWSRYEQTSPTGGEGRHPRARASGRNPAHADTTIMTVCPILILSPFFSRWPA